MKFINKYTLLNYQETENYYNGKYTLLLWDV